MPDRYYCVCRHCGGRRLIRAARRQRYADDPTAPVDLIATASCKCPKPSAVHVVEACDSCGELGGEHWLGCDYLGLPTSEEFERQQKETKQ